MKSLKNHILDSYDSFRYQRRLKKFFKRRNSTMLYCRIPNSVLLSYIKKDLYYELHSYLDFASSLDLKSIDKCIDEGRFISVHRENYLKIRILLKIGLLTKQLKVSGMLNPTQLLLGDNQEAYIVHPGSIRIIVNSIILENNYTELFYCWDKEIDPSPFVLDYVIDSVKNPDEFYNLFLLKEKFDVLFEIITEDTRTNLNNGLKLQIESLQRRFKNKKFSYDFLTTSYDWNPPVESRIKFRDFLLFHGDNECTLSGIKFKKINSIWIKS